MPRGAPGTREGSGIGPCSLSLNWPSAEAHLRASGKGRPPPASAKPSDCSGAALTHVRRGSGQGNRSEAQPLPHWRPLKRPQGLEPGSVGSRWRPGWALRMRRLGQVPACPPGPSPCISWSSCHCITRRTPPRGLSTFPLAPVPAQTLPPASWPPSCLWPPGAHCPLLAALCEPQRGPGPGPARLPLPSSLTQFLEGMTAAGSKGPPGKPAKSNKLPSDTLCPGAPPPLPMDQCSRAASRGTGPHPSAPPQGPLLCRPQALPHAAVSDLLRHQGKARVQHHAGSRGQCPPPHPPDISNQAGSASPAKQNKSCQQLPRLQMPAWLPKLGRERPSGLPGIKQLRTGVGNRGGCRGQG